MHTHNLSQHVHRIGYHFPSTVVATVCMDLGLYLTASGKTIPFHGGSNAGNRKRTNSEVSQITINTEARDVLKDLFPNIPTNDLNQIIKTAFQKVCEYQTEDLGAKQYLVIIGPAESWYGR